MEAAIAAAAAGECHPELKTYNGAFVNPIIRYCCAASVVLLHSLKTLLLYEQRCP
jgi:hypothetical protein